MGNDDQASRCRDGLLVQNRATFIQWFGADLIRGNGWYVSWLYAGDVSYDRWASNKGHADEIWRPYQFLFFCLVDNELAEVSLSNLDTTS